MTSKPALTALALAAAVSATAAIAHAQQTVSPPPSASSTKGGAERKFYPERAQRMDVPGLVALNCGLTPEKRLTDCRAVWETPQGYAFGEAAVRLYTELDVRFGEGGLTEADFNKTHTRLITPVFFTLGKTSQRAKDAWAKARPIIVRAEFGADNPALDQK